MTEVVVREPLLTDRQKAFVAAYLRDPQRSATAAYKASGYQGTGHAAEVGASKLMKHPGVISAIQAFEANQLERIRERAGISLETVLTSVARSAFADVRKLFKPDGTPLPINELPDDVALAIEGVEVLEQFEGAGENRVFVGYVKKYKLARRSAAQEMLMKHLNAYKAHEQGKGEGVVNGLVALLGQMKRSALPVVHQVEHDDQAL